MKPIYILLILFMVTNSNAFGQDKVDSTQKKTYKPEKDTIAAKAKFFIATDSTTATTIKYGQTFFIELTPATMPASKTKAEEFTLIINRRHFPQYAAKQFFVVKSKIRLMFLIDHSNGDDTNLAEFLGEARNDDGKDPYPISIEVIRAGESVTKEPADIKIEFYTVNGKLLVRVFTTAIIALLVFLAIKSNLLKEQVATLDLQLSNVIDMRWSLAKTQLAIWTMAVAVLYLMIWIITYTTPTINDTVLALLGISFATTAVGITQPSGKVSIAKAKTNFLLDLIDDGNGASIHRFQNVVFLGVFVAIFIGSTYSSLEFPTFDNKQLLLLGISSAGYLGIKFLKEKP